VSESISELGKIYGVASVDMSPDEIWNTGGVWLVWCQTRQMDGVLLMFPADQLTVIFFTQVGGSNVGC